MGFSEFLSKYSVYIALAIFLVIVVLLVIFLVIPRLKHKESLVPVVDEKLKENIYLHLGGTDNVSEIKRFGSRLSIVLVDQSLVNLEELKKLGVDRAIIMKAKIVLVVNDAIKLLFDDFA